MSRKLPGREGFSLVEVCMAIGVVGFCFAALLGLLHLGMVQQRRSLAETEAAHILSAVLDGFQGRVRIPEGIAEAPSQEPLALTFPSVGSEAVETSFIVDETGKPQASSAGENLYVVHYRVEPPASTSAGCGPYVIRLLVAWPGQAAFTGSGSQLALANAQGSVEATLEVNRD